MTLFESDDSSLSMEAAAAAVSEAVEKAALEAEKEGKKVGRIDFHGDVRTAARLFFKELRKCDTDGVDIIFAAGVADEGLGEAVMDRMRNAAGESIVFV